MIEIILTESVAKIGAKGAVAQVAPGYAQFLIKSGKAKQATTKAKAMVEKATKERTEAASKLKADIKVAVKKLSKLIITAKANEQGHLFEGIGTEKIAEALRIETKLSIPESALELKHPLKEVGEHTLGIATDSWKGSITVVIEAE